MFFLENWFRKVHRIWLVQRDKKWHFQKLIVMSDSAFAVMFLTAPRHYQHCTHRGWDNGRLYCQRGFLRKQERFCDLQKQPSEALHYSATVRPSLAALQPLVSWDWDSADAEHKQERPYSHSLCRLETVGEAPNACKTAVSLLLSPMATVPHIAVAYLFRTFHCLCTVFKHL